MNEPNVVQLMRELIDRGLNTTARPSRHGWILTAENGNDVWVSSEAIDMAVRSALLDSVEARLRRTGALA